MTQGQPVAAAAAAAGLALLATVLAWELWGPAVEQWRPPLKVEPLQSRCRLLSYRSTATFLTGKSPMLRKMYPVYLGGCDCLGGQHAVSGPKAS